MERKYYIKTYKEILEEIANNKEECHLLLGNGFNLSLGVKTGYKNIFQKMIEENSCYSQLNAVMEECNYDIELMIGKLQESVDIASDSSSFIKEFIASKIKYDFMKACYGIVKNEIKRIYQEENEGLFLLFKNFKNYFSLNYDPLLYLLLMHFKKEEKIDTALAFSNTLLFKEEILTDPQQDIYHAIKQAREKGLISIDINSSHSQKALKTSTKKEFESAVRNHFKNRGWSNKDIKKACDLVWEQESGVQKIDNLNDGFLGNQYIEYPKNIQNIFFLHGAFHIYKDKKKHFKITQQQDAALYNKLEDIINSLDKDILCVFQAKSLDKMSNIQQDVYLNNCFNKLANINGSLMILGSALSDNDKHIFEQINKSQVSKIYISSGKNNFSKNFEQLKKWGLKKEVCFFDYETISYSNNKKNTNDKKSK